AFLQIDDQKALETIGDARRLNERYIAELEVIFSAIPAVSRTFPHIADETRVWFRGAERAVMQKTPMVNGETIAHGTGREMSALHDSLDRANLAAWAAFASKRHKLMIV